MSGVQAQSENDNTPAEDMSEAEWRRFEEWMENEYWQLRSEEVREEVA